MISSRPWFLGFALSLAACTGSTPAPRALPERSAPVTTPAAPPVAASAPLVTVSAAAAPLLAPPEAQATIEIVPARRVVAAKKSDALTVRIRAEALPIADTKRPPIDVALVVDASGSMEGAGIEEAKRACAAVVDELRDGDALSIVTFGSQAKIVVEASRVTDKSREAAKKAILGIRADGTTDMAGGLRLGIEQARALLDPNGINRIVLIGDGVPNDPALLPALADQAASLRLPVSSLGLGPEFDETQMSMLAQRSGGSFHFVADSGKVAKVFHEEIARMERVVAKNAWVELTPGPGVEIAEAIGMASTRSGRKLFVQLGDLPEGRARDVVVDVKVAGRPDAARVELMDAVLHFTPVAGDGERTSARFAALDATSSADALLAVDLDVEHEALRLRVADAVVKAMASARAGDVRGARALLDTASKLASDGAKRFDDATLTAKVKEIRDIKKTIASLAPPPALLGASGGGSRMKRTMAMPAFESAAPSPAAALGMREAHGDAMKAIQGE